MAGSVLKGAWLKESDQKQGSVGLRCKCDVCSASRNLAGMIGTSGSDALRIVESGDLRALVEELDRLAEEIVEAARVGGNEL